MKFSYVCPERHETEQDFPAGGAPRVSPCLYVIPSVFASKRTCELQARRNFGVDFASASISTGDPFRSYHLSTAKARASGDQQRAIGGPTDNFERKRLERDTGVAFVGNDTSGMSAAARRGIEKFKERKKDVPC